MRILAALALLLGSTVCEAASAERRSADGAYEITVPRGWRFNDMSADHQYAGYEPRPIFHLASAKGVSVTVSADMTHTAAQALEKRCPGARKFKTLADGSVLRYCQKSFTEVGRPAGGPDRKAAYYETPAHEVAGILAKVHAVFAIEVSSGAPPDERAWAALSRALASLRSRASVGLEPDR